MTIAARVNPLVPRGSSADKPFELVVTPETRRLGVQRPAGPGSADRRAGDASRTGDDEMLVLPLSGGCDVTCDDERVTLTGRRSVFSRVTDFAYVPRDSTVDGPRRRTAAGSRCPSARAGRRLPFRYGAGRGRAGGAARRRAGQPAGQQLLHAGRVRVPTG